MMSILEVSFFDESGVLHSGELVNAATIVSNNGQYVNANIDQVHTDEVVVLTYGPHGDMRMNTVLIGNVRYFRPMVLPEVA